MATGGSNRQVTEICEIIRKEAIDAAKQEAAKIIENANGEADKIISQARNEAGEINEKLKKTLAMDKSVFESSLRLAAKQSISKLKQSIEEMFCNELEQLLLDGGMKDANVIAKLINAIVDGIEKEGLEVDLKVLIPKTVDLKNVSCMLTESVVKRIGKDNIILDGFSGGVVVKMVGKKISIEITDQTIKELLSANLNAELRSLVFACDEQVTMTLFYVFSSLPSIQLGYEPEISSEALFDLFEMNFGKRALNKVMNLRLLSDLNNIYFGLVSDQFDRRGNYSKELLDMFVANEEVLPDFVFRFFSKFKTKKEQVVDFQWVTSRYFKYELEKNSGFLLEFMKFEYDVFILSVGYRSFEFHKDVRVELRYEDFSYPLLSTIISQNGVDGKFTFPEEFRELELIFLNSKVDPTERYEAVASYKFNYYRNIFSDNPFSLKSILAYMMCLWIVEDDFALNADFGEKRLDSLVESVNE